MEAYFLQTHQVKSLGAPYDANTPAVTPVRIDMRKCRRVAFLISLGASTGATVAFALKQHNGGAGGTTKALEINNPYFFRKAADTAWTKVDQNDTKEDTYDLSTQFAADEGMVCFEVLEEELDTNGGFTHVSIELADTTVAKTVSGLAIIVAENKPAYSQTV